MAGENLKFDPHHANVNNPNTHAYWQARGYPERPKNWKELYPDIKGPTSSKNRSIKRLEAEMGYPYSECWPLSKEDY